MSDVRKPDARETALEVLMQVDSAAPCAPILGIKRKLPIILSTAPRMVVTRVEMLFFSTT